jgi:5-methylcytosine-specific restriction endonuclease McrA
MSTTASKRCSRCRQDLPLAAFHVLRASPDGRQNNCKVCKKAFAAAASPQIKVRMAEYYQANKSTMAAQARQWRVDNRERDLETRRAQRKRAYVRNEASERARSLAYNRANPDKRWTFDQRRRAKKWGVAEFTATYQDWLEILEEHGHRCAYCGAAGKMHTEHQVPFARGGQHTRENIVPACHGCNVKKDQLTADEFREVQARRQAA